MNPGAVVRHEFEIEETLSGRTDEKSLVLTADRIDEPLPGYEYFLVERPSPAGLVTVWWDFAYRGLCIDRRQAREFGIDDHAVQALQHRYPCVQ